MPPKPTESRILVVPHTHWDRAWYWPLERFRVKLIELFEGVFSELRAHADYRFTFDGQAIMVEDYLEAYPQARAALRRYGRQGRIRMGPMYVLADLYCTGGEALIRNLLIGGQIADSLGARQRELHMPDTFGLVPSIPMIAAGFGATCVSFMRGLAGQVPGMTSMGRLSGAVERQVPEGTRLFHWTCPDGSAVRVMLLRDGYANAARLGRKPGENRIEPDYHERYAVSKLRDAAAKQMDRQGAPYLLLAGVDHQIPQPQLTDAMRKADRPGRLRFVYSDLDEMAGEIEARSGDDWPVFQGEFHGSGGATVLGGTVSSRIYLKQANAEAERLLTDVAEPADALALMMGIDDPAAASIHLAWKHVLKTHPHDDICGCSVDTVHDDNEHHLRQATDAADAVRRRMVQRLLTRFGGAAEGDERYGFIALNPQPVPRRGRFRVQCDFEGRLRYGDIHPPKAYAVVDDSGREVPFREVSRGPSLEHPHPVVHLEVDTELAPTTLHRFFLEPRSRWPRHSAGDDSITNEHLRLRALPNGTFDLEDLHAGRTWRGLGLFSDQADVGDSYDFADIPDERETMHTRRKFTISRDGRSGLQTLTLSGTLPVAESTRGGKSARVDLPIETELSLAPGARALECRIRFSNRARDHRLRWNLALPFRPRASRAGLKFNEVTRPAGRRPSGKRPPRVHPIHPADRFVAVEDRKGGLAVFSEFPFNYELVGGRPARLAVTLLRAVGFLSRGDLSTRRGNAGPDTPVEGAQCLRDFEMRFAVRPYGADEADRLFAEASLWRCAPITGLISAFAPEPQGDYEGPLLALEGRGVVLSALKRTHRGANVVCRLHNTTSRQVTARLFAPGVASLKPVNLAEEPDRDQPLPRCLAKGVFEVDLPSWSLRTFALSGRAR
jgi:2-O-(6-phospho-alpha-D-mannosyl)-D-glycerate hydrolase